jgi:hypothetical protein
VRRRARSSRARDHTRVDLPELVDKVSDDGLRGRIEEI